MPPLFWAPTSSLNCHNTEWYRLSSVAGALARSTLQHVHHCTLGNTGKCLCFSELHLMFDVCSCQQRCCNGDWCCCYLWWKYTDPCREPTKRGCCIAFSSAKVCPEIGCVCVCVSVWVSVWRGQGDFSQLSYWNCTGSHCITVESLNHSLCRASSLADFDTALTQCTQLTHFNDHVAN